LIYPQKILKVSFYVIPATGTALALAWRKPESSHFNMFYYFWTPAFAGGDSLAKAAK